jgi:cytochrome P450
MSALPVDLPRAGPFDRFTADPLNFLRRARATHGDLFVLREPGAIFSRAADSPGVIAAFGIDNQRAVLTDLDSFGMPVSAAHLLNLPPNLVTLNRGLHSLTGSQHTAHRRSLAALLTECADRQRGAIAAAVDDFAGRWHAGSNVHMLAEMRELSLSITRHLLFGDRADELTGLAQRMRTYFQLRREASSPANPAGTVNVDELARLGNAVDTELRSVFRACRTSAAPHGILGRLATTESAPGTPLSEDEAIGHANVLFISSTEPVAVALTWLFLILSQRADLRRVLREEKTRHVLLGNVIDETLRILPPNAFMVRTTTRPVMLGGIELPAKCEIVLCPFVSHRDPKYFVRPDHFVPDRWNGTTPSPFVYFPFGGGGHSCVGRALALSAIRAAVTGLLSRYDLVLADEREVDWRLHIIFMPRADPLFAIRSAEVATMERGNRLHGPVAALVNLDN